MDGEVEKIHKQALLDWKSRNENGRKGDNIGETWDNPVIWILNYTAASMKADILRFKDK